MKANRSISDEEEGNSEWAHAMNNILNMDKPKSKKSFILSRADKLDPKLEKDDEEDDNEATSKLSLQANLKKEWMGRGRYKPNPSQEGEKERKLRRIAVAGVVQLFNAVGKHQRTSSADNTYVAKTSVASSTKMFKPLDKKSFLGLLLGKDELKNEADENELQNSVKDKGEETKEESTEDNQNTAPKWDVLRNDFMMSTKLKDWDKEIEV